MREQKYWEYKRVSLLTELLRWVDILHFVSIDVDQDDLGGAVRQTGVQTGHCDPNNNTVIFIFCSEDLKKNECGTPELLRHRQEIRYSQERQLMYGLSLCDDTWGDSDHFPSVAGFFF